MMNLNNTPSAGKLTAADFIAPAGCDDQGRWPTRRPMAAEAATDEGAEPDFTAAAQFWSLYLALLLVALVAVVSSWA